MNIEEEELEFIRKLDPKYFLQVKKKKDRKYKKKKRKEQEKRLKELGPCLF